MKGVAVRRGTFPQYARLSERTWRCPGTWARQLGFVLCIVNFFLLTAVPNKILQDQKPFLLLQEDPEPQKASCTLSIRSLRWCTQPKFFRLGLRIRNTVFFFLEMDLWWFASRKNTAERGRKAGWMSQAIAPYRLSMNHTMLLSHRDRKEVLSSHRYGNVSCARVPEHTTAMLSFQRSLCYIGCCPWQ